ncbi:hypothetical protein DFQ00_109109 [Paenibacillus barcinonensis]|uniref:Uncharacterized protein n=1 Tax=Paenibacillus barcinonensis TaxID=198119 RepID=A0A2V4V769_PAEBA|nr:hypothetical protein DFQ00_109109 [Paenibacillus barcinonensis]
MIRRKRRVRNRKNSLRGYSIYRNRMRRLVRVEEPQDIWF